jgi:hypothetical protein
MDNEEDMINNGEDPIAGPSNTREGEVDAPLSKNAIKRAARQVSLLNSRVEVELTLKAKLAEAKPEKRKAEKIRRRENAQKLYEAEKAGTLTPEQQSVLEARQNSKILRARAKRRENRGDVPDWKGGVVIDLDFDHLMTDQVSFMARISTPQLIGIGDQINGITNRIRLFCQSTIRTSFLFNITHFIQCRIIT